MRNCVITIKHQIKAVVAAGVLKGQCVVSNPLLDLESLWSIKLLMNRVGACVMRLCPLSGLVRD